MDNNNSTQEFLKLSENNKITLFWKKFNLQDSKLLSQQNWKDFSVFLVKFWAEILNLKYMKKSWKILHSTNWKHLRQSFVKINWDKIIIDKQKMKNPKLEELRLEVKEKTTKSNDNFWELSEDNNIENEDYLELNEHLKIESENNSTDDISIESKIAKIEQEVKESLKETKKPHFNKIIKDTWWEHYLAYLKVLKENITMNIAKYYISFIKGIVSNEGDFVFEKFNNAFNWEFEYILIKEMSRLKNNLTEENQIYLEKLLSKSK